MQNVCLILWKLMLILHSHICICSYMILCDHINSTFVATHCKTYKCPLHYLLWTLLDQLIIIMNHTSYIAIAIHISLYSFINSYIGSYMHMCTCRALIPNMYMYEEHCTTIIAAMNRGKSYIKLYETDNTWTLLIPWWTDD